VLISGFDILFFWDARMAMQGLHFMKEVPWKTLYLHGLVRAADGSKMSKSKGNTVDPLGLIDKYGADALRFTLTAMESQGRDIKLDEKRVEGYRNFATKLWNAARFAQSNGIGVSPTLVAPEAALPVNRWIIAETIKTVQALDLALADLRFDEAANTVYQFTWASFCDWYLELIKPVLSPSLSREGEGVGAIAPAIAGEAAPAQPHPNPSTELRDSVEPEGEGLFVTETRAVAGWVLDQILVMLHPFMPFITEELWHALGDRPYDLIHAKWPMADVRAIDPDAGRDVEWLVETIQKVRSARTELNVPSSARTNVLAHQSDEITRQRFVKFGPALHRLARLDVAAFTMDGLVIDLKTQTQLPYDASVWPVENLLQIVVGDTTLLLPVGDIIDLAAERARLTKSAEAAEKERDSLAGRLNNPSFVERAKPEAVEKARADHADKSAEAERIRAALARLG
jgi:valyl-tRNA synthetase